MLRMRGDSRKPALVAGMATLLIAGSAIARAASDPGSLESSPGIHVVTFSLPAGRIYVNLPGDLTAGDTASATVNPVPAGVTGSDQERQRQELSRYSLELAGARETVTAGVRTFTVPPGATGFSVKLFDPRGRPAGEVKPALRSPSPPPAGYVVPSLGQGGGPVRIAGAFDGDLSTSAVRIDGKPAQPMAESPRQLVVRGPEEGAPPATMEVSERGSVVATGSYRNVSVRLSAPLTNLLSGQRTTLTGTVTGVEGLEQTLPVRLTNQSPDVVRMEGGEEQTLCVRPDEVKTDGTWTRTRGLTGVRAGGFGIHTELTQPGPQAASTAPTDATLRGELLARVQLDRDARTPTGERLAPGAYQVAVRGAGDRGRVRLELWRDGKAAGTVDGAVLQRLAGPSICDVRDVSDARQARAAGAGDRGFGELGFNEGSAFVVRAADGHLRLVLVSSERSFSIEADLASP
jgi:hypothetical protein